MTPLLWPVWSFADHRNPTVAMFFDWSDAVEFVQHPDRFGAEPGTRFIGEARKDRRAQGYRHSGLVEVERISATRIAA